MANSATLADTILRSVTDGYYPDSEEIASADLTNSHLPTILKNLEAAKDDVKRQVRVISHENASSIDSWVSQARQLHADIEASKSKADEILKFDEEEKALAQALRDAETRQQFLTTEIRFNEALASMLGKLQLIGATLAQVNITINQGELDQVAGVLTSADVALDKLQGFDEIIVVEIMKDKAKALRRTLFDRIEEAWSGLVTVEKEKGLITILGSVEVSSVPVDSKTVIATLDTFDLLKGKIDHFHQQIDHLLIAPLLETREGRIPRISTEGCTLRILEYSTDFSVGRLFSDLRLIIEFLDSHLPAAVMSNLSRILIPNLTNRLISTRLSSSVPPSLEDLPTFEELLEETKRFEDGLYKAEWTRQRELNEWVERAPKVWLAKRRESSLGAARKILAGGIGECETIERSETQTIHVKDEQGAMVAGVAEVSGADDWNADWNDDGGDDDKQVEAEEMAEKETISEGQTEVEPTREIQPSGFIEDDEDDDVADGWGLDEDLGLDDDEPPKEPEPEPEPVQSTQESTPESVTLQEENDDDDIDWGAWGDDDGDGDEGADDALETSSQSLFQPHKHARKASIAKLVRPSSSHTNKAAVSKDVTLTETYTITSIPRALLAIISRLLSEATDLQSNPQYESSPIVSAAPGILAIPTLILAIFRALAPLNYSSNLKSNMYLYNDCSFLSSHLPAEVAEKDVSQILTFGKRQYSREMEAQRTIFCDFLDGAQGFVACTDQPQQHDCDTAVSSSVARLREIHSAWRSILSKSALYQSVGSLLHTVVTKLINDIEDLGDISEPESVGLASYCADIAALEELFPGRHPDGPPVTAVYCGNWLKFRYLAQILESSMADIMFLVRDGCLREFEKEEVADLVRALFAESEMRERCIADIRRGDL